MSNQDSNPLSQAADSEPTQLEDGVHRRIRSFVLRQGRLTKAQERALQTMGPQFCLPYQANQISLDSTFGRQATKVLEIGFGMGDATAKIANTLPETDFLAVEVHTPGVGSLLKHMEETGINNIRIIQHDAVEVIQDMLSESCLDGVHIFFPDPWHKKRHHKRRLIQSEFVKLLCSRLKSGGYIHVATDWQEYAEWVLDVLSQEPLLANTAESYAPKPEYRPLTKFENRGIRLGHGVWDMVFTKR